MYNSDFGNEYRQNPKNRLVWAKFLNGSWADIRLKNKGNCDGKVRTTLEVIYQYIGNNWTKNGINNHCRDRKNEGIKKN